MGLAVDGQGEHPRTELPEGMVGPPNEDIVSVEGIQCCVLLDSGSQVTTLGQDFYQKHLSHIPIQDLNNLLTLKGAQGVGVPTLDLLKWILQYLKPSAEKR